MLYDYLVSHYKKGEPIFIEDIHIEGMNRPNFCQQLKTLTDNGKLKRYEKGIYYLPKETLLKAASGPSSETIAKYKYISRNGITNGFFQAAPLQMNLAFLSRFLQKGNCQQQYCRHC